MKIMKKERRRKYDTIPKLRVRAVVDYADIKGKFCRPLADFKGTIKRKKYLGVFTYPIAIF